MRILHTSDWHLGKRLDDFSRLDEQRQVLEEITAIAEEQNVDVVVLAGDLFDTFNPPTEAVDLLYKCLKRLSNNGARPVIAIAGNHDSPDRIESPDPLARECGIVFVGYPHSKVSPFSLDSGVVVTHSDEGFISLMLPNYSYPLRVIATPYANELRMRTFLGIEQSEAELRMLLEAHWSRLAEKYCDGEGCNLLLSHLFFIKEGQEALEEADDERTILHVGGAQAIFSKNIPKQMQYVALGHLHRRQVIDTHPCPIVYAGSPLSYSFAEANQRKYVVIVELKPSEEAIINDIPLQSGRRLLRHRSDSIEGCISWLRENSEALVELTIVSDTYLTAQEQKLLRDNHSHIIQIIPEVKRGDSNSGGSRTVDLNKSTEELFVDYFLREKGQQPSDSIMSLFKEILAEEEQ